MKICKISYGSSTAKCFATSTRSKSTHSTTSREVWARWKLPEACQSRGISKCRYTSGSTRIDSTGETSAESSAGTQLSRNIVQDEINHQKKTSTTSNQQSTSESNPKTTSSPDVSNTDFLPMAYTLKTKPSIERRPLPLSPLMDPEILISKQKHKAAKLPLTRTPTPFQKQLARNPFARALGTPVRRCAISGTKLPNFFLQGFRVMSEPKTGEPWYVPTKLANKHLPAKTRKALHELEELEEVEEMNRLVEAEVAEDIEESKTSERVEGMKGLGNVVGEEALNGSMELENLGLNNISEDTKGVTASEPKPKPSTIGYQAYTLNRKYLLQSILKTGKKPPKNKLAPVHNMLIPMSWRGVKSVQKFYEASGWRPDMEDFVPMIMGRRITEALAHICGLKRGYLVGCTGWEDALTKKQVAAYLWTGGKGNGETEVEGPPEFATLDVGIEDFGADKKFLGRRKKKIPVYNLQRLLGKEKMDELRRLVPNSVFEKEVVVLKHKNATVKLQLQLWKIQGYLAEHLESQVGRVKGFGGITHEAEPKEPSKAVSEKIK